MLILDNELCEYKISEITINKNRGTDPEIDEDSEGNAYSTVEYIVINSLQLFHL
jgi:hypothetical protein